MNFLNWFSTYRLELSFSLPSLSIENIASAYFCAIMATTLVVVFSHMELISKDFSKICLFLILVLTLSSLFSLSLYEVWRFQRYSQLLYTFYYSPAAIVTWLISRLTLGGFGELLSRPNFNDSPMMMDGQEFIPAAPAEALRPFLYSNGAIDYDNGFFYLNSIGDHVPLEAGMTQEDKRIFRQALLAEKGRVNELERELLFHDVDQTVARPLVDVYNPYGHALEEASAILRLPPQEVDPRGEVLRGPSRGRFHFRLHGDRLIVAIGTVTVPVAYTIDFSRSIVKFYPYTQEMVALLREHNMGRWIVTSNLIRRPPAHLRGG